MLKQILKYGLIAGLIVGIPMLGLAFVMKDHPPTSWGMAIGYLTMLIAFSTIFLAIKRTRDIEHGGVIRFWPALGLGLGISVVASIIYVLCWEAVLATTGMDYIGAYGETLMEEQKAQGASAETIAALAREMQQLASDYANPLFRMPLTFTEIFPIGLLVSLVSAGLLRNSRFLPAQRS
jgi:hypothetical protein